MNSTNYNEDDAVNQVSKTRRSGVSTSVMNAAIPISP